MKKNPKAKAQTAHCVCPERNGNAAQEIEEKDMETCSHAGPKPNAARLGNA